MSGLSFSISDYQRGLSAGIYDSPDSLCPYYEVDPIKYCKYETGYKKRGNISVAFDEIRYRTAREYYRTVYPIQSRMLSYSSQSFPAYRFILPEVLAEDWLGIVDWGKYQRDHVLHQPLCGYMIQKILRGDNSQPPLFLKNGMNILDYCVDEILEWKYSAYIREFLISMGMRSNDAAFDKNNGLSRQLWRIIIAETAYLAAVFHDLGYPWQYAERLHGNLGDINSPAIKKATNARQVVDIFKERLIYSALQGYREKGSVSPSTWMNKIIQITESALTGTHGFPGALGFLHLNDCVRVFPSNEDVPLKMLCIEWAAVAVMMHDMAKIYWGNSIDSGNKPENFFLRLNFQQDPVSSLVALVDFLQEYGRPAAAFYPDVRNMQKQVVLEYQKACSETELEIDRLGIMKIRFIMDNDEARAIKRAAMIRDKKLYFDPQYGYLDMSSIGVVDVQLQAD